VRVPCIGRILGRNPNESLKRFPPCDSQSPLLYKLQLCLRFLFLQTHATSCCFCKGERRKTLIGNHNPFPMVSEIQTETSSLRTLKIMPRNLNVTVRSWIRLQDTCGNSNFAYFNLTHRPRNALSKGRIIYGTYAPRKKCTWTVLQNTGKNCRHATLSQRFLTARTLASLIKKNFELKMLWTT
jgi:hypothetical protein